MKYQIKAKLLPPPLTVDYLFLRYRKKLVNTAASVFTWENLPETFDETFLNNELIEHGSIGIIKTANGLSTVRGNVGGEINEYYKPTQWIYANPVLGSGSPTIGEDVAVIFLTSEDAIPFSVHGGLSMLIDSTAMLMADNTVSLNVAQKNSRIMLTAVADNESTVNSAENVIRDMYNGKSYKVITKKLSDSFEVNPLANTRTAENMRQLIENQQYIWAQYLQELGINSNFNLKRERLTSNEVALNTYCLDTLVDDMEENVNRGLEMCNKLFGTDIKFSIRRYSIQDTDNENSEDAGDVNTPNHDKGDKFERIDDSVASIQPTDKGGE